MVKSKLEQDIIDALEAQAPDHGIDVVDVDITGATKAPCVRVRIDRLDGEPISLDEVSSNTGWVSDAVEALDPVAGSYTLEVSSPGMKRPLRRASDFARYTGSEVELATTATEGRRSYKGTIAAATDDAVTLTLPEGDADGASVTLAFNDVKKATLKPVYDFKGTKEGK